MVKRLRATVEWVVTEEVRGQWSTLVSEGCKQKDKYITRSKNGDEDTCWEVAV